MPLFGANEVLPIDPPIHPFFIRTSYTFKGKRRRTRKSSSKRAAAGFDDEDLLSDAWVKMDLERVRKKIGRDYADYTFIPPSISLEVDFSIISFARRGTRT